MYACGIEAVYKCFNGTGIWGGETTGPLDSHNTFKILYFRLQRIVQGLISSVIIKKIYIYLLSHLYLNFNCTNPLPLKFMTGPRDNGGHLCTCFGIYLVTVDLQGVLTMCRPTHVGFGRGWPLWACNIWVSQRSLEGHHKVKVSKIHIRNYTSQAILSPIDWCNVYKHLLGSSLKIM